MEKKEVEEGNIISFIFSQPGNDTTYGIVIKSENNKFDFYDVVFGIIIKGCEIDEDFRVLQDKGESIYWDDITGEKTIRKNCKEECEKYISNQIL